MLIIDKKEKKLIKELTKRKIKIKTKQIPIDIIIQSKQNIGIEIKTTQDFLNSIIDKRILNQLSYLKENFTPLLIIQGTENLYAIRNFHPNSIRGMLSSIAINYKIPILHTRNTKDTASLLITILKKQQKTQTQTTTFKKTKPLTIKQQQELIIQSLPQIGPKLSKMLLKKFKTIKKIINASSKELKKIPKLGPKKIQKIKQILEKKYN